MIAYRAVVRSTPPQIMSALIFPAMALSMKSLHDMNVTSVKFLRDQ